MSEKTVINWLERNRGRLIGLSDTIWEYAELGLHEAQSVSAQADFLRKQGFSVKTNLAGMPTALMASYGDTGPVIAFLGEYDALPGTSQKPLPYFEPVRPGGPGHACGHNLLGVGALAAAAALKTAIENGEVQGTVRYYGCPAEETLVGKVFMVRAGLFEGVDAALTWHPASLNALWMGSSLAMNSVKFRFQGRSSHAAGAPELGRSALDAVELMNTGVNYLREHVMPQARIHYVITEGGREPNVVPPEAEVWYYVRAPQRGDVDDIYERIVNCARGAALMTGTTFKTEFLTGCYNMLTNEHLSELLWKNMQKVGAPEFTEDEQIWASQMTANFPAGQRERSLRRIREKNGVDLSGSYLHSDLLPPIDPGKEDLGGSTDVADVSWVTPTAQFGTACSVIGAAGHSWQFTASAGHTIGHKGMFMAAKILGLTGLDLLTRPGEIERARVEFERAVEDSPYRSPLPEGAVPPMRQFSH